MSSLLRSLKFTWDYFLRGRHGTYSGPTSWADDWRAKLDWHDDPLVGRYVRTTIGTWWTDTLLKNLGYEVRLIAPGQGPTVDQIASFEALAVLIPDLVVAADLEPIPKDDGWGVAPPPFDIRTAHVGSINMRADDSYFLIFDVDPEGVYMLAPAFTISPKHTLISAEWSV
jgi:hypothetical protein